MICAVVVILVVVGIHLAAKVEPVVTAAMTIILSPLNGSVVCENSESSSALLNKLMKNFGLIRVADSGPVFIISLHTSTLTALEAACKDACAKGT